MLLKKLFFSLLGLFCALALCIAFLPWFVSTTTGKDFFLSFVTKKTGEPVKAEKLSLSWSGPQVVEGLTFETSNHQLQFASKKISCSSSLWNLLLPSKKLEVNIPSNSHLPLFNIPSIGNVEILQGKISVLSGGTPIVFDLAECRLLADKALSKASLQMKGETLQNNIQGTILVDASALPSCLESRILLKNFPIDGVNQILSLSTPEYRNVLIEAIGPSLDLEGSFLFSEESYTSSLDVKSEKLEAHLQTEIREEKLSLLSSASLKIIVSPLLQKRFLQGALISDNPLSCMLECKSLTIPLGDQGLLVKNASFQGTIEITSYQIGTLTLGCSGGFSSSNLSQEAVANLNIQINSKEEVATAKAQISCKDFFASKEIFATFDLSKTPTSFLETLSGSSLSKMIGNSLQGKVTLEGPLENIRLTAEIASPLLQMEKATFTLNKNALSLLEPFKVEYVLIPGRMGSLIQNKNIVLGKQTQVSALFSQVEILGFPFVKDLKADASLTASALNFSKLFSLNFYNIENLSLHLKADSLSNISLDLKSDRFKVACSGKADLVNRTFSWDKPAAVYYLLSNQELESFYKGHTGPALVEKTPVQLEIDPGSISLNNLSLNINGHLRAKELLLKSAAPAPQISFQNIDAAFQFSEDKDTLDFSLSSKALTGTLACQGSIKQLSSSDLVLKANLDLQKFPVALIDTLTSSSMLPIIGESIDLKLAINKKNSTQTLWIDGKSPLIKIVGGVTLDSKALFLTSGSSAVTIEFILTQAAYEKLSQSSFALDKSALFKVSLSKLYIPFLESAADGKSIDFSHLLLSLQAENDLISFVYKGTKKPLSFTNTKLSLQKKDEKTPLSLSLDTGADADQKGSLHLDAQCKKLLNEKGDFELSHMESDIIVSFQKFPSALFDILVPSKNKTVSSLLGPSFEMTLKSSLQNASGPLAVNLRSQNIKLSIEGALTSGVLTLRENVVAEVALTPDTSKAFLKEVNPLSISSISSSSPLSIEIASKGFSLPLSPFSLNQILAPRVRVLLGKVLCHNEGNINLMLGLLKSKQAGQNKQLELWFAPLDLSIEQGVLNLERTEVLVASTYDIALWGRIDLPTNRVSMVLGLTAPCLNAAFNIRDLPSDYVMHIPLTGTLDHVELNKTVATSKIVALTLWQSKSVAGPAAGVGGAIVGGLLNKVLAPPGNEDSTPKAKKPYPWEK